MIDLFAGAGGLSLGLERAGFRPIHAVEYNAQARASYLENRPYLSPSDVTGDIRTATRRDIQRASGGDDVELVAGGPPCQGFSEVGKRHFDDERNHLFRKYIDWVREIQPAVALFENVRGFTVKNGGEYLRALMDAFTEIGYHPTGRIVHGTEFGVPQLRHRLVIIASRSQLPAGLDLGEARLPVRKPPSVMDAIGDLPEVAPGQAQVAYHCAPTTVLQRVLRGDSKTLFDHEAANHPDSLVRAISFIPDGGNRTSIPNQFQPRSGYHNSYARLRSSEPAVAITSNMSKPSSARCIHPFQNRGLTAREGARLQTFPDAYRFVGGAVSRRLQIGNAVPPFMAEAIGAFLMTRILGHEPAPGAWNRLDAYANGAMPARSVQKVRQVSREQLVYA